MFLIILPTMMTILSCFDEPAPDGSLFGRDLIESDAIRIYNYVRLVRDVEFI